MSVRVATFNLENLFARYRFRRGLDPAGVTGFGINDLAFSLFNDTEKRITGQAIREVNADILCLQEVENLHVLERFNSEYLARLKYKHRILIDSHDPRFIDVAVLSRYPFSYVNTHRHERSNRINWWLFSRDCLEVDIEVDGKILSLYVNHYKSMMEGRDETKDRRKEQVERTAEIVDNWWKPEKYKGNFIVAGDFNDYEDGKTSLKALLNHPELDNVVSRLPANEQWTHYWDRGDEYRQLDYLLLSKALAKKNTGTPEILRKGLPFRAEKYDGPRYDDVGASRPKASDHCPLYMDLELI